MSILYSISIFDCVDYFKFDCPSISDSPQNYILMDYCAIPLIKYFLMQEP